MVIFILMVSPLYSGYHFVNFLNLCFDFILFSLEAISNGTQRVLLALCFRTTLAMLWDQYVVPEIRHMQGKHPNFYTLSQASLFYMKNKFHHRHQNVSNPRPMFLYYF